MKLEIHIDDDVAEMMRRELAASYSDDSCDFSDVLHDLFYRWARSYAITFDDFIYATKTPTGIRVESPSEIFD